jgi:hypothetical protein
MCHGHPHYHSCGHQSVTWHYCPSALIDLETGYETPCPNITFAASQSSTAACPLANCDFRSAGGGGWTCCKCGGRNSSGWCLNASPEPKWEKNSITNEWEWMERCDHGCCRSCTKDRKENPHDHTRMIESSPFLPWCILGTVLTQSQLRLALAMPTAKMGEGGKNQGDTDKTHHPVHPALIQ